MSAFRFHSVHLAPDNELVGCTRVETPGTSNALEPPPPLGLPLLSPGRERGGGGGVAEGRGPSSEGLILWSSWNYLKGNDRGLHC
eukprot:362291-Chlamydomonas_euryale.AAC.2